MCFISVRLFLFSFFNDTATTEIYTLSLHDALPISAQASIYSPPPIGTFVPIRFVPDRKSTRLNSSHLVISYAVFCLKKTVVLPTGHSTASLPQALLLSFISPLSR